MNIVVALLLIPWNSPLCSFYEFINIWYRNADMIFYSQNEKKCIFKLICMYTLNYANSTITGQTQKRHKGTTPLKSYQSLWHIETKIAHQPVRLPPSRKPSPLNRQTFKHAFSNNNVNRVLSRPNHFVTQFSIVGGTSLDVFWARTAFGSPFRLRNNH